MSHHSHLSSRQGSASPAVLGGILLMVCTVIALAAANSPWSEQVSGFWHHTLSISFGSTGLTKPLILWINDGLMAIFFFMVGLELKREFLFGSLTDVRRATVPLAAAIGGMVVPAALYYLLAGRIAPRGWGIPMATDIAFALGVLALLGSRVPPALRVFLATLAVIDDLGAVLVIAIFYTAELSLQLIGLASGLLGLAVIANFCGVRAPLPYAVIGLVLWVTLLKSGVHATIAGVALACVVPMRPRKQASTGSLVETAQATESATTELQRLEHASTLADLAIDRSSPGFWFEHLLVRPVALVIMPIFALCNAGVTLATLPSGAGSVAMGVGIGLTIGKPLGILACAWLTVRLGLGSLTPELNWQLIHGAAWLAGIGFTMSLFVTGLAFTDQPVYQDAAKIGILVASLAAGVIGTMVLLKATKPG